MAPSRHWFDPVLLAPVIFVCHFLEESPSFVLWFNSHVARGITSDLFWTVNLTALVITLFVVVVEWLSRSTVSAILTAGWFGFLMGANALFHVVGGFVDGAYVPGLVTAVLLYIPYYSWLIVRAVRRAGAASIIAAIIGAMPMVVHGYLILFRRSRLF